MKLKFFVISFGMLVIASSCNNSSDSAAKDVDTTAAVVKDPAVAETAPAEEAPPPIDSAAVTKAFLDAQQKSKKANPGASKKQGKNEVVVYNEHPIPSHEALQPATKTVQGPERVVHTKEYVYFLPSQNASFPGGQPALTAYIKKNMVYPEDALKYHVEGTVYAEVTLDTLGYVTNVEFPGTRLGSGLEEATAAVLKGSPRWIPAKENGVRVTSKITVPVVYKIKQ